MNDFAASDATIGALLAGRYRVIEPLGSGGMARVYLARDEALGRSVAVKVLRSDVPETASDDRARIETSLLASLSHHALVTLFDAHLDHEPRFFVMENVLGPTLAQRIRRGPLTSAELSTLALHLGEALHVVHEAGIVHRDVKPSNILLAPATTPDSPFRAKLADFGIAHLLDAERVTSPQLVIGTAAYIAPEVLHGGAPAPPSDIYALGLVLLEAATASRAFGDADGGRGQLLARLTRDPDLPASLDDHWSALLADMTARSPGVRPSALEVMRRARPGAAAPTRPASVAVAVAPDDAAARERAALADVATAAWTVPAPAAAASAAAAAAAAAAVTEPFAPAVAASTHLPETGRTRILPYSTDRRAERVGRSGRSARAGRVARTGLIAAAGLAALVAGSLVWSSLPDATTTEPADPPATVEPAETVAVEPVDAEPSAPAAPDAPAPAPVPVVQPEPAPVTPVDAPAAPVVPDDAGGADRGNGNPDNGNRNSGNGNSGNANGNSGNGNPGNGNPGNGNSGNGNSGNGNSGNPGNGSNGNGNGKRD